MEKKVFLLIQGHTIFCDAVLENVKNVENVIWSTDDDAPVEHQEKIKNSNVVLLTTPRPNHRGYGNVNVQIGTTMKGLELAKSLGATHVIKLRSDLIFTDPKRFIDTYNFDDRIHQLAYCKHTPLCINITNHYPELMSWVENNYPNLVLDTSDYNYICDFTNLGPIEEMLLFWSLPYEPQDVHIPAEFKIVLRYLKLKGYKDVKLSYEWFSEIFGFYISYCKDANNTLTSLKRGWTTNDLLNSVDVKWVG